MLSHSTLGLRVIEKKKKIPDAERLATLEFSDERLGFEVYWGLGDRA